MCDLRLTDRRSCLDSVTECVRELTERLSVRLVLLFGSQARGDTHRTSDYDLFVLADDLPHDYWARQEVLRQDKSPWGDVVGFTVEEAQELIHRGLILDALLDGVLLWGERALLESLQERARQHLSKYNLRKTPWG